MQMDIIKIGNSKGIRLPLAVLKQCGIDSKVKAKCYYFPFGNEHSSSYNYYSSSDKQKKRRLSISVRKKGSRTTLSKKKDSLW